MFFLLILISFLIINNQAFASMTNGTIDPDYHYAWGENIGWVDFKNITISDTALTGSVYGENIGWIYLSTITNTNTGILSGYAWGENVGWVDFSKATIGTDGVFSGGIYGENIGWITFGTNSNKVLTDWRPASVRPQPRSSGSYLPGYGPKAIPVINPTPTISPTSIQIPTFNRIIKLTNNRMMRGNDIRDIQSILNTKLSITLTLDGIYGPKTRQAVLNFQKLNNIKQDGIVGPITISKFKSQQ